MTPLGLLATAVLGSLLAVAPARASDVEVSERAGETIAKMADAVRDFRLTPLAADLEVRAKKMEYDYRNGILRYEGNVDVRHGEVRLHAEVLSITFEPENPRTVRRIEARGKVRVEHETETAEGEYATYDTRAATITLTGNATLGSGPNRVRGERVVVFLDEGRATVEGGASGPVRAVIEPKSKQVERLLEQAAPERPAAPPDTTGQEQP